MDDLELLIDMHRDGPRQGPGGDDETRRAIELTGLADASGLRVADIGCGSGASTLVLADRLDARVTAVDRFDELLRPLRATVSDRGLDGRISVVAADMTQLPFRDAAFDIVWSEGAIYVMGFERGVTDWRRLLRPGGVLAVSELTWLTDDRPDELTQHWEAEYPEVDTAAAKLAVLERSGFSPIGYFSLGRHCWLDHYYRPLQRRFDDFLVRHDHAERAQAIVDAERREIELYERHASSVSYGFYVARRTDA